MSFYNGNCVEVADLPGGELGVWNSKDIEGPVLRFIPDEWHAFLGGIRNGKFDGFGMAWPPGRRESAAILVVLGGLPAIQAMSGQLAGVPSPGEAMRRALGFLAGGSG
jgi:hypothetical protein